MNGGARVTLLSGVALTADRYSYIIDCTHAKEVSFEVGSDGTGTPAGTWKFQSSNDPQAAADFWTEQKTASALGASSTAKWTTLTASTVQGDSLTLSAAAASNSTVAFALGTPAFLRVWFDHTGGGTSSTSYVYAKAV